ncbi:MAG: Uma2 family endonuclease [Caldilineaceae bacterium]
MTITEDVTHYTPEAYLVRERTAEARSEYRDGDIHAMAGASRAHNLIAGNTFAQLHSALRSRPCETYMNDMRVKVAKSRLYTYPDVVVVCGEPRFENSSGDVLLNPTVIVEVLSPSTEGYDRGDKFFHYRRLSSLQEYVLIAQESQRVEHYARHGDQWLLTEFSQSDHIVDFPILNCGIPLSEIYARVEFPDEEATQSG